MKTIDEEIPEQGNTHPKRKHSPYADLINDVLQFREELEHEEQETLESLLKEK